MALPLFLFIYPLLEDRAAEFRFVHPLGEKNDFSCYALPRIVNENEVTNPLPGFLERWLAAWL